MTSRRQDHDTNRFAPRSRRGLAHEWFCRGLALVSASLLVGCGVSVRIEPLSDHRYPERPKDFVVEVLDAEPAKPHVKLARVIATSEYGDEDALNGKILDSARRLGADAVVMGRMDVLEGPITGQRYTSTVPVGAQNSPFFGGMGSGIPYFFDPWTYVQGGDRVDYTNYKSGLAIRYLPDAEPARAQPVQPVDVTLGMLNVHLNQLETNLDELSKRLAALKAVPEHDDPIIREIRALDVAGWELHQQQWVIQRDHLRYAERQLRLVKEHPERKAQLHEEWMKHEQEFEAALKSFRNRRHDLERQRLQAESKLIERHLR